MSTAIPNPPVLNEPTQQFVLEDVSFDQFVAISDALGDRPLRLAYDGERLEFMTTSWLHERWKSVLSDMIRLLTLELNLQLECGGQTTFKSSLMKRGLEPDSCFWIQGDDPARGAKDWIDGVHRPPDLAIEIAVSRGVVDRLEVFAKLGVPELWVFDGSELKAFERVDDQGYQEVSHSVAFPFLTLESLVPFLLADGATRQNSVLKLFLAWLKDQNFPGAHHS